MSTNKNLKFFDLGTSKKLRYMELCNKIDTQLGEKFVKAIPLRAFMAVVTGGTSLIFTGVRQGYQLTKKANAIGEVKSFVEFERSSGGYSHVEWNTFPGAHIVVGGSRMDMTEKAVKCPLCKHVSLRNFVADSNHEIMTCGHCNRIITVKVGRFSHSPEEIFVPGVFVAAIPFTDGIENLGDLAISACDFLGDVAGFALDLIA